MDPVLTRLTRAGWRRSLGGSRPWTVALIVTLGARTLRRLARPKPDVLYRTRLRPGDRLTVTARRPSAGG